MVARLLNVVFMTVKMESYEIKSATVFSYLDIHVYLKLSAKVKKPSMFCYGTAIT